MIPTTSRRHWEACVARIARTPAGALDAFTGRLERGLVWLFLLIVFAGTAGVARSQLNIPVVRGDVGLQSGTQPGPGVYVTGLFYFYNADEVVDANGTKSGGLLLARGAG